MIDMLGAARRVHSDETGQTFRNEWFPLRIGWRPSIWRILLAGLTAHYVTACCYWVFLLSYMAVTSKPSQENIVWDTPAIEELIVYCSYAVAVVVYAGSLTAIALWKSLALTLPLTWMAARFMTAGATATAAASVIPGILVGKFILGDGFAGRHDISDYILTAALGAVFALVVWLICIRPRREHERDLERRAELR